MQATGALRDRAVAAGLLWLVIVGTAAARPAEPLRMGLLPRVDAAVARPLARALRARLPEARVEVDPAAPDDVTWLVTVTAAPARAGYDVVVRDGRGRATARRLALAGASDPETAARGIAVLVAELMDAPAAPPPAVAPRRRPLPRVSEGAAAPRRRPPEGPPAAPVPARPSGFALSLGLLGTAGGSFDVQPAAQATAGGFALRLLAGQARGLLGCLRTGWQHAGAAHGVDVDLVPLTVGVGWRFRPARWLDVWTDAHAAVDVWTARGARRASGAVPGGGFAAGLDVRAGSRLLLVVDARLGVSGWPVTLRVDGAQAFGLGRVRWSVSLGVAVDLL